MTIKELIEELKKFDCNAEVMRADWEYGPSQIQRVSELQLIKKYGDEPSKKVIIG